MPHVQRLVPAVAVAVANEATAKATVNAVRMFCYNLLCNCNWNSREFGEVVKLTCDYIWLNFQRGFIRDPELGINDAVTNVLTLYSSALLFQYPGLQSVVDRRVYDAATQNAPQLEVLKKESYAMYQHPPGYGTPGHQHPHHGMGANAHAPMHHGVGGYHPGYHHGGPGMHPGHAPPGHYNGVPPGAGHVPSGFGHNRPAHHHSTFTGGSGFVHHENAPSESDRYAGRNRRRHVEQPHQQQQPTKTAVAMASEKLASAAAATELIISQGSEMDRAQHQLTYFGSSYHQDLRPRAEQFQKQIETLSTADPKSTEQRHVYKNWLMCSSLEDAVTSGRVEQHRVQSAESRSGIFRCFAVVAKPIISVEDISSVMASLREASTFIDLANKIRATAKALEQTKGSSEVDSDTVVNFLSQVDNRMTRLINDFLRINLSLEKCAIDSFAEDVHELSAYLNKKYGIKHSQALATYENEIFEILGEEVDEETFKDMKSGLEIPSEMYTTSFPENYSITYVFMNSRELGYNINAQVVRVNQRTAPALHQAIQSLVQHKSMMRMATQHDVVVTSDDVKYKVYRDYINPNEYMISAM
jgi:hypothetical protein